MSSLPRQKADQRSPYSFMPQPVDFVGQQTGPVEDELKTAFLQVFAATPTLQSAFLARIYSGTPPKQSVALCMRSTIGVDDKVQDGLNAIFKLRFRDDQRLDFLFLVEEEETRLREVCPPFYERPL